MSDDPTPTPGAEQGGEGGNYTPPATQADLDRIIADRLSRERQKFADYDELKSAAEKLAEIEEANKTEAQRLADERDALAAKVTEYETREQIAAWKAEVAEATGVPAGVLAGSTKEEIEAHAESLKPLIAQPSSTPAAPPVPTVGQFPATTPGNVPIRDQIAAAEQAGNKELVAALKAMQLGTTQ